MLSAAGRNEKVEQMKEKEFAQNDIKNWTKSISILRKYVLTNFWGKNTSSLFISENNLNITQKHKEI